MTDKVKVGAFTWENGTVSGPKEFMESKAAAECFADIEAGRNVVVNACPHNNVAVAILVAIQTCYAAWKGTREFLNALRKR